MNIELALTEKDLELYRELQELAGELIHPPPMTLAFCSVSAIDPSTGKVIDKQEKRSDSWVRNFKNAYISQMCGVDATGAALFQDGEINIKDTGNVIRGTHALTPHPSYSVYTLPSAHGDDDNGLLIGTNAGATAESDDNYILDTQIDHGLAGGEMEHFAMIFPVESWDGGTRQWTFNYKRYFINRSGGSITVNELGIFGTIAYSVAASAMCLLARDVLGAGVAIANNKCCKAEYTLVSTAFAS